MESYTVLPEIIERFQQYGYRHRGNQGIEGREVFERTAEDGFMNYHLYVCPQDGKGYLEHIAFRDYLRAHPSAEEEYEQVKLSLARQYCYDREAYTEGKTELVRSILDKALH